MNTVVLNIHVLALYGALASCLLISAWIWLRKSPLPTERQIRKFDYAHPTPCLITDENGRIVSRNAKAQQVYPVSAGDQTMQDYLSHMVADPNSVVFRALSQLASDNWANIQLSTRSSRLDVTARLLSHGRVYWRVIETKTKQKSGENRGLSLTLGRHGAILSIGDPLLEVLGSRPKNLRDFMEWPLPKTSGTCRLKTQTGIKPFFCLLREVAVGRDEMTFFELPEGHLGEADLFKSLPIPMLKVDGSGAVLEANEAYAQFLGGEKATGQRLHDMFRGVSRPLVGWVGETLASDLSAATQFAKVIDAAKETYVQINLCRMHSFEGPQFLVALNDATEFKSLEAQFVQSQKMQAIGQLAGGVAHDFNNLLTAITGHCDLLLLRHGESDPDFADLDQIRQNANRAAALVSQLLAFSRKQTLQPQSLDLEQTLSDHTHLLNRLVGEKTTLVLQHGANLKRISADKRQFEQVVMNLVVNARDAMGGKGRISIATERSYFSQDTHRDRATIPAGEYCSITVSDQGCGIEPDKLQRIFEPFYTSKGAGKGTGLGLSTVYGIVKQSGGFIFVDSVVGVGTSFELLFPVATEQAAPQQITEDESVEETLSETSDGVVLLVEDEAPVRAFASRALQLKGFSVLEASCAEEALALLSDKDLAVDIFVTDVVMPGVDGPTWVSEALKSRPDTKVVFVSGYAENKCDTMKDDIPNSTFLPKPFSLNQLTSTVARLH